jgi:hypothetical protein
MDDGTGTYVELNSPYNAGGSPAAGDTDYFIQSTSCATQTLSASKSGLIFSMVWDNGSDLAGSFGTDDCYFVWQIFLAGTGIDTWANGGLRLFIGADLSNGDVWKSGGSDFGRNPYGGWANIAIDPTVTPDYTIGTPTAVWRYFGSMPNTVATISKGAFHGLDVSRYGRGELIVEFGTGADPEVVFQDIADDNDSINNRWGLFQSQGSSYLWKGLMSIGNATNACEFVDANVIIFVDDTPRTFASFNRVEIKNTSTIVDWTAVSFTAPNTSVDGSVLSPGEFEVVDNATVTLTSCTFTDMSTFTFNDGTNANTIINTTFRRCGEIATGGATMTGCTFDSITSANHVSVTSPANAAKISGGEFISDGTGNGLVITGTAADFTLTDVDFTGYSTTVDANKAIYVNIASGTVNLTISGGSGVTLASHVRTAGATINLITGAVTVKVTTVDEGGDAIGSALVHLRASDATGPFPYRENVTISRSTTLATVTHTGHGMASNDKVFLLGITDKTEDNGVQQITVTTANAYTFATTDSGSTSYTGDSFIINGQDETSYDNSPTTEGTFSGGTGHSVSDVLKLDGAIEVTVDAVSGGVVTQFTVDSTPGNGGRSASEVVNQRETTGSGTGFSLTLDTDNLETVIKSTFVALEGTTHASLGTLSLSRVYSSDQPVEGWTRKAASAPYFKEAPLNTVIDNVNGLDVTAVMVSDE